MARVAEETAYFFNSKILTVALVARGVRVPTGTWLWVANGSATPAHVEEILASVFPSLRGKVLLFVSLSNEAETQELERSLHP
jgi:hypothetical protein